MYNYSIMILDTDHLEEICQDIKYQYENNICDLVLFCMTLTPEGTPAVDKASLLCAKYDAFRDRLAEMGLKCGVLAQATIGHGYIPDEMHPFQSVISFRDGEKTAVCCPLDINFRKHMADSFEIIAKHCQTTIMVDDDFRLLHKPGMGCGCPLHMAEFNKRAGTNLTRDELCKILENPDNPQKLKYKEIFLSTQTVSLEGCAKEYRAGIDRVNPSIQGCFCTGGNDKGGGIAKILAGNGNPTILRVNNGEYTPHGARNLATMMYRAAEQMALDYNKADIHLAETDTCPQLRYAKGAMSMHSHYIGTILEGTKGAKHWITKLNNYEPECGVAYRKVLSENAGLYQYLKEIVPHLKWRGARIPLSHTYEDDYSIIDNWNDNCWNICWNGWVNCVLERLGLPMYFSKTGKTAFFDYEFDTKKEVINNLNLTKEEIKEMLKGWTFMSSTCAQIINKMGWTEYTGVMVEDYKGPHVSKEHMLLDNKNIDVQCKAKKLIPINENVEVLSEVYHLEKGINKKVMFPGVTKYKNPLGGTSIVFCGTPTAPFHYTTAFSYLNMSRKLQLTELLKEAGELPVYYPEDAEIYLRAGDMEDGSLFVAIFNIGFDPIPNFPLIFDREISKIEILTKEGKRERIDWTMDDNVCRIDKTVCTLDPVILFVI
ncbi:MAG: hypothetical protein IJS60_00040 [Abditibacteriota bacterium]|nr:hypothetical protein [Abditibacteriota bacterium]